MEENLFDCNGVDFSDLMSDVYMSLSNENEEFIMLKNNLEEIFNRCNRVEKILEGEVVEELNQEELKLLSSAIKINHDLDRIYEKQIFFTGGKEAYTYFKNIGILK